MNQTQSTNIAALKAEVARFREELNTRDLLVQQLSQELFRLVKDNGASTPIAEIAGGDYRAEVRLLRERLQGVEQQVQFYHQQLHCRDVEIQQLRQTVRELSARGQMLEQVIRELPKVYSRKFAERLAPIKNKIMALQSENRQLQSDLVSVTDRLAAKGMQLDPPLVSTSKKLDFPNNISNQQSSTQPTLAKPAPSTVVFSHV